MRLNEGNCGSSGFTIKQSLYLIEKLWFARKLRVLSSHQLHPKSRVTYTTNYHYDIEATLPSLSARQVINIGDVHTLPPKEHNTVVCGKRGLLSI